ncbi:hypothetical protein Q0M94_12015 [Deinococcus radiomollis]|uniref:hypothetical protein n=1 Tax=Deinococcus radiomollis TaxID=468916 RepID=UPI00389283FF
MSTETLSPADLARLLLDAAPCMELIERVAPHLPHLRPLLPMLGKWAEVEQDLAAARAAPAHLQASFHKAVFVHLAQTHGGTEALWGALAHEMRHRHPPQTTSVAEARKAGLRPKTPHTEDDRLQLRRQLEYAQRLVQASPHGPLRLSELIADRCGINCHHGAYAAFKSGRFLRELEQDGWPTISAARLSELVIALELLQSEEQP